jgi:hemolysin activation/secretion protein
MSAKHRRRPLTAWRYGYVLALCALIPSAPYALAQTGAGAIAPPASPIPRVQPPAQPQVNPPKAPEAPPAQVEAGPPVHIVAVEIDGATAYPPAKLQAMLSGLQGATVTRSQVVDAVRAIETMYRNDGYFLTAVRGVLGEAPSGTRLRVEVTEGYINSVKIDGDAGPVETLIYSYFAHLTTIRPVRITDVERYALLAENVSGMTVRTILRSAGTTPGAVDLVAQVQRKPVDAIVTDDNRGPRTAGPNEMLIGIGTNSFTSFGERFQAIIYDTPFNDQQVFGQASLEGFVGSEGIKVKGYVGSGTAQPGDILKATGFQSDLHEAGVSVIDPVLRTRALSVSLSAAFDVEESTIDLPNADNLEEPTSKTNLRVLRLGQTLDVQDDLLGAGRAAANTITFTVHRGLPSLWGQKNDSPFVPRPLVRNDFTKVTAELIRVQNLYAWDTYSLALKLAFAGQWTNDVLPPIEKYYLGGEQYGRGFFSGEVTGDDVAAGTAELQLNDSIQGHVFGHAFDVGTQYYTFYDVGQTWPTLQGDLHQKVESAGLGVRANFTSSLSTQVEGVRRFTRRPTATFGSVEPAYAAFFRIVLRY